MSWIQDTFNKSLFTEDSYKSAIGNETTNGYAVLRIIPELRRSGKDSIGYQVVGIIQNPLSFSIDATWEKMGGISGLIPSDEKTLIGSGGIGNGVKTLGSLANTGVNVAGFAELGSVYASRKIYKQSGYLEIGADLRVVNWQDDGQPLQSVLMLSYLTLPDPNVGQEWIDQLLKITEVVGEYANEKIIQPTIEGIKNINENVGNAVDAIDKNLTNVAKQYNRKETYEGIKKTIDNVQTDIANAVDKSVNAATDTANRISKTAIYQNVENNIINGLKDYYLLRSSPTTVRLQVGEFFNKSDMILENVSYEFSKEMTRTGPLYVDIKLKLSSRTILGSVDDIGIVDIGHRKNNGKVIITY